MTEKQQDSLDSIAKSVARLTGLAQALAEGLQAQIVKAARIQRAVGAVVVALALGAGVIGYQVAKLKQLGDVAAENGRHIAEIQERTSGQVLCPMWEMFLGSYRADHPEAVRDPKAYEQAFSVIEAGAATLGCKKTTRGR